MKRLKALTGRIPIRWRLTLISLGLFTVLLSGLGIIILITAEQALLSNQATALRNEGRLVVKGIKNHPFLLLDPPGPPAGPFPSALKLPASILTQRLTSGITGATILSPDGTVLIPSNDFPLAPPPVTLPREQIRQEMATNTHGGDYLLPRDAQGKRQIVVLMPLVNGYHTVAILQLSTPTAPIDQFITTLRLVLLLGVVGALSIAIALTFPLIDAALHPLVEIERTSRRIAQGALSMRLDTPLTNDEIGHLTVSFNRMVEQLEEAFKRQKRFVADASHELRTPLTVLSGSLEMLLMGADNGDIETSRRLARGMYAEVQRMQRLVEGLLALTRLDEGIFVLLEENVDVRIIIDKVYDQAQQLSHDQEIRCEIDQDIPLVRADGDRLQQVLLNIVENALKFSAANGLVELVAYREEATSVAIEIRDNGKGIPAEALPHVFDRFYRADQARSRQPQHVGGNGLGLAIAKELIEAQQGTISIRSTPGKGTTVTIRLCAVAAPSASQVV